MEVVPAIDCDVPRATVSEGDTGFGGLPSACGKEREGDKDKVRVMWELSQCVKKKQSQF